MAKYNIYPCETSEEALELVNRKKYNKCIKFFKNEFVKTNKESFLEFSMISLVIIEREDFEKFDIEKKICPNREERILYHGKSIEPISSILTGLYRKSLKSWDYWQRSIFHRFFGLWLVLWR